jgi:hypothetical protein
MKEKSINIDIVSLTPSHLNLDNRARRIHEVLTREGYKTLILHNIANPIIQIGLVNDQKAQENEIHSESTFHYLLSFFWNLYKRIPTIFSIVSSPLMALIYVLYVVKINFFTVHIPKSKCIVIHESIFTLYAILQSWLHGTKIVVDVHDDYSSLIPKHLQNHFDRYYRIPIEEYFRKLLYKKAHYCFTVSRSLADELNSRYCRKFLVIRSIPDFFDFHPSRLQKADGIHQFTRESWRGIFIGNYKLSLETRFLSSDSWINYNPSTTFEFVGEGYDDLREKMSKFSHVKFRDPIDFSNDYFDFNEYDFGFIPINPSDKAMRHALPNGLFILMFANLPTLIPGLSEMIQVNNLANFALVTEFDRAEIVQGQLSQLSRISLANRHASIIHNENFSWNNERQIITQVFHEIFST